MLLHVFSWTNWASRLLSAGMLTFCRQHPAARLPRGSLPFWLSALDRPGFNINLRYFWNTSSHWLVAAFNIFQPKPKQQITYPCHQGSSLFFAPTGKRIQKRKQTWDQKYPRLFQKIPTYSQRSWWNDEVLKFTICHKAAPCAWCTTFDTMDWTTSQWLRRVFSTVPKSNKTIPDIDTITRKQTKPSPLCVCMHVCMYCLCGKTWFHVARNP